MENKLPKSLLETAKIIVQLTFAPSPLTPREEDLLPYLPTAPLVSGIILNFLSSSTNLITYPSYPGKFFTLSPTGSSA